MTACEWRIGSIVAVGLVLAVLCPPVEAGYYVPYSFDYAGVDVAPGAMESVFGTKVDELDAVAYGFNFQFKRDGDGLGYDDPLHGHRNLNVISRVYVATQAVSFGLGNGGTTVELQPGDYTFAYTLDFTDLDEILTDSSVGDFQILRTITNADPAADNPGPVMALGEVLSGAYNTNSEYGDGAGTPAMQAYPDGMAGAAADFGSFIGDQLEYDWGSATVDPGDKAMVLMFTSPDVQVWQIGWGSQDGLGLATSAEREAVGHTAEGASVIGGGESIPDSIPVLIPVVPEPATLAMLGFGLMLARPGRKVLRRRTSRSL